MGEIALYAITAVWLTLEETDAGDFQGTRNASRSLCRRSDELRLHKRDWDHVFDAYFAPPELSSDNAAGAAILCRKKIFIRRWRNLTGLSCFQPFAGRGLCEIPQGV